MLIRKLNEELCKVLSETQIEHVDEVEAIKQGTYEGDRVGEIVLNNINEFNVDELIAVLENFDYYRHQGGHILFPSGYDSARGPYPAKLAEALAKSKENESITDIYNIFYARRGDLQTWGEAAEMWQRDVLQNFDKTVQVFSWVMNDDDYDYYIGSVISEIEKGYPLFAKAVKTKLDKAFK